MTPPSVDVGWETNTFYIRNCNQCYMQHALACMEAHPTLVEADCSVRKADFVQCCEPQGRGFIVCHIIAGCCFPVLATNKA